MALNPYSIIDTFSRTESGEWGTSDSIAGWMTTSSVFNANGTSATATVSANQVLRTNTLFTPYVDVPPQNLSSESLSLMRFTSANASNPRTEFGPILNKVDGFTTFYYASIEGNDEEVAVGMYINNFKIEFDRTTTSIQKDQWYWVRFRRTTSYLRIKIWKKDTLEPGSWTLEAPIQVVSTVGGSGGNPTAGLPGYFFKGNGNSYVAEIDTLYYYTLEDAEPYLPVVDNFNRTVHAGWGVTESNHAWLGNVSDDPNMTTRERRGSVTGAVGILSMPDTFDYYGLTGPDVSGPIEAYFEFEFNSAVSGVNAVKTYLGLYGNSSITAGVFEAWGYGLLVQGGGTTIQFYKKTAAGGAWTAVGSSAAITAMLANTTYKVRLQREGTALRARFWTGGSEPGTWDISTTDASITHGSLWFQAQNPSSTRTLTIGRIEYLSFIPTSGTAYTATASATLVSATDTTMQVRFPYTNDSNDNNTLAVFYRHVDSPTWINIAASANRGSKWWTITTLTGLIPNSEYLFKGTFSDADVVTGVNPILASFSTTNNQSEIGLITTDTPTVSSINAKLTYSRDNNANATANLYIRSLGALSTLVRDVFADNYNGSLVSHIATGGHTWTKHATSTAAASLELYRNRVWFKATDTNQTAMYLISTTPASADYNVGADIIFNNFDGKVELVARMDAAALTGYAVGYNYDAATNLGYWYIAKYTAGVYALLAASDNFIVTFDTFYSVRFELEGTSLRLYLDGSLMVSATDATYSSTNKGGIRYTSTTTATSTWETYPRVDNFTLTRRSTPGSWTLVGAFTAYAAGAGPFPAETHRYFHRSATGLSADTLYELRGDLADADGIVDGVTQVTTTGQTVGNKSGFLGDAFSAVAYPTSISAVFTYAYDADNDSTLAVQYKAAGATIWTTLNSAAIVKSSLAHTFTATPTGLTPATTYEFRGTLTDPDGILEGYSNIAEGSATTRTYTRVDQQQNKRYVWKVYDNDTDEYVESWHDASAPEFTYQQNGGVSDLTVRLRRPISELLDVNTAIKYFNRVDVWVHDTFASGLGPNLIEDESISTGSWTLGADTVISGSGGVDGGKSLKISTASGTPKVSTSEPIYIDSSPNIKHDDMRNRTFIISVYARARKGKLVLSVGEYRDVENGQSLLATGTSIDTVGTEWQLLRIKHRIENPLTEYIRVQVYNDGVGDMWVDTVEVRTEEMLLYSGRIEQISPFLTADQEYIDIQILGDAARLSDTYVEWLQYVLIQGTSDFIVDPSSVLSPPNNRIYKENRGPADPSVMIQDLVTETNKDNPKSRIYFTPISVKNTDFELREYTFKEVQVRAGFDHARELCPAGWHYFIEPDGLVWLRGPEHARTHILRIGVEATKFEADLTIRNMKNFILFKGRQDDDVSEPDGNGTITSAAFDKASMEQYGKRMMYIRDARVKDPDTADAISEGRLEELNRPEQRSRLTVLDEKTIMSNNVGFKGYNIESFRPGDFVIVLNPRAAPEYTYWDQAIWDESLWDSSSNIRVLSDAVPIKTIQYHDTHVVLELSERPPSSVGDFGRMLRILQKQQADGNE